MPALNLSDSQTLALGSSAVKAAYLGSELKHFNPKAISGCVCNLDASVPSSLRQNSDGTTAASAEDDPVGYWADLSGLGNHAKQTVATGSRPFLKLGDQNGRPGLLFDGSNDFLTASITGLRSFSGLSVISVVKSPIAAAANTDSMTVFCFGNIGAASGIYEASGMAQVSSTGVIAGEYIAVAYNDAPSPATGRLGSTSYRRAANTAEMLTVQFTDSGTEVRQNNETVSLDLSSAITTSTDTSPSSLSFSADDELHICATRNGASLVPTTSMTLNQMLVYNRRLLSSELALIWAAMVRKWGL